MKKSSKRKTTSRTASRTDEKPSQMPYLWAAVAVAAIIALIAVAYFAQRSDNVLVTVNGEEIKQDTLDFQYNLLPESYRSTFTKDQVLEQVIDETLVVQAAHRDGLAVSSEEVLNKVQGILSANEITITELQENLAKFNVTQEQFESLIERQIIMERYLNQTLVYAPADESVLRAVYDASRDQYATPEQVTVQHVLISNQRTDAALLAKSIYDSARNGTDFCLLAQNYSDDRGSRETCGEYTFPRGFMDPVFEGAAFEMKDDEVRLIQTQFGYHIVKRISFTPEGVRSYEEVRGDILAQYDAADRARQYRIIINRLRDSATIVYANGTRIVPQKPTAMGAVDEPVKEPETPIVEPVDEPEPSVPSNTTNATAEPVVSEPQVEQQSTEELLSCIAAKATLYGTSWSSDTQSARDLFAGYDLRYVACDSGTNSCARIKAYPTWEVGGEQYLGRMTIEQLRNAAGC